MRKVAKIPRILKINSVKELTVSVVFNNGESRVIDFADSLKKEGKHSNARILLIRLAHLIKDIGPDLVGYCLFFAFEKDLLSGIIPGQRIIGQFYFFEFLRIQQDAGNTGRVEDDPGITRAKKRYDPELYLQDRER